MSVRASEAAARPNADEALHRLVLAALGHDHGGPPTNEHADKLPDPGRLNARGLDSLLAYRNPGAQQQNPTSQLGRRERATWALVDVTLHAVAECLSAQQIRFVLLKGAALTDLYPAHHLRPMSDLDILVAPSSFAAARAALEADGWQSMVTGRYAERYLHEEGSCWQARKDGHAVLELHFRLWGSVPTSLAQAVIDEAQPRRADGLAVPSPAHSLLIAASHWWRQAPPRRAVDLVDAALICQSAFPATGNTVGTVPPQTKPCPLQPLHCATAHHGQSLPLALTLDQLRQVLKEPSLDELLTRVESHLHKRERAVLLRARTNGSDQISWPRVRLAMLLAGRPSRAGWRSLWRQLWPHPGVLEQRTAAQHPWAARRLTTLWRAARGVLLPR